MKKKMPAQDIYECSLFWILRERAGGGGWPPRDIIKVSGWTVVRMLANVHGRSVREVAKELIELATVYDEC